MIRLKGLCSRSKLILDNKEMGVNYFFIKSFCECPPQKKLMGYLALRAFGGVVFVWEGLSEDASYSSCSV